MKLLRVCVVVGLLVACLVYALAADKRPALPRNENSVRAQVPNWSQRDLDFFLHGSMSTEMVPESVLRAFIRTYPDLFPSQDLSHLGLIPDAAFGWPVGFSRRQVPHLGGLSSVGINCASCHVGEVAAADGGARVRVLGMTSLFDAEGFFGAVIVSGFRTADPANMKRFLGAYLAVNDPAGGEVAQTLLNESWQRQEKAIVAAMSADSTGGKDVGAGELNQIDGKSLRLDSRTLREEPDLAALSHSMLKLFHNMRAALHVPDQPPDKAPPASGPGRNDAFGLLSAALLGAPQPYAPVKYGLVWNVGHRPWVHWDGNTRSPIGRNLLATLGLGAPLIGKHGELDFTGLLRQTTLSETISAPRYPFAIDQAAAKRGAAVYQANCAKCHDGAEGDSRLYGASEVGTDSLRAELFTPTQAERLDKFLAELEIVGYQPPKQPGIRSTQKYFSPSMWGVWARSPYLHNGSVRTMDELLTPPEQRAKSFHRGTGVYDTTAMGYRDEGAYLLDTTAAGNSNAGHNYGTSLANTQKKDLIEYLKTK